MIDWSRIAVDFEWDGSLRDIYIVGATETDWDSILALLRGFMPAPVFTVDGVAQDTPRQVAMMFKLRTNHSPKLTVMAGTAVLNCHFFGGDLEFDLDPRDITGAVQAEALGEFMQILGDTTNRAVLLCHENSKNLIIARYTPPDDEVVWEGNR